MASGLYILSSAPPDQYSPNVLGPNPLEWLLSSFFDGVRAIFDFLIELLIGTIFSLPRIETDGPFVLGRPEGQPLGTVGDFFTPSLMNAAIEGSYQQVWIGNGGEVTIAAIALYTLGIVLSGQYEMISFDTSDSSHNKITGLVFIILWYPIFLAYIIFIHGFVHTFVDIGSIAQALVGAGVGITTGLTAIGSIAGPAGMLVGIILAVIFLIVAIIPFLLLAIIMGFRAIVVPAFFVGGPFIIAAIFSDLPVISKNASKGLIMGLKIAGFPIVMVPVLFVFNEMILDGFGSGASTGTTQASVLGELLEVLFSGALAFGVMGIALLIAVYLGLTKASGAAGGLVQSVGRSAMAAGIIGAGSKMDVDPDTVSRAAGLTVRAGAVVGAGQLISGAWDERRATRGDGEKDGGNKGESSNGEGDREVEQSEFDSSSPEEWGEGGSPEGWGGEGSPDGQPTPGGPPTPGDGFGEDGERTPTTDNNTISPGAGGEDTGLVVEGEAVMPNVMDKYKWDDTPTFSARKIEEFTTKLHEDIGEGDPDNLERSELKNDDGYIKKLVEEDEETKLDTEKVESSMVRQKIRYAVAERFNEKYDTDKFRETGDSNAYNLEGSYDDYNQSETSQNPGGRDDTDDPAPDLTFGSSENEDNTRGDSSTSSSETSDSTPNTETTDRSTSDDGGRETTGGNSDEGSRNTDNSTTTDSTAGTSSTTTGRDGDTGGDLGGDELENDSFGEDGFDDDGFDDDGFDDTLEELSEEDQEQYQRIKNHLELNPSSSVIEVLGATQSDPGKWQDTVEEALDTDDPGDNLSPPN